MHSRCPISGKKSIIAHFEEDPCKPGSDGAFEAAVIDTLEDAMLAIKADLGVTPLTAIFPPWGTVPLDGVGSYSFKYEPRFEGDGSIQASVKNDFPQASSSEIIGFRQLFPYFHLLCFA